MPINNDYYFEKFITVLIKKGYNVSFRKLGYVTTTHPINMLNVPSLQTVIEELLTVDGDLVIKVYQPNIPFKQVAEYEYDEYGEFYTIVVEVDTITSIYNEIEFLNNMEFF